MNDLTTPPDDADLHAWVDGLLAPGRRAAVRARLGADPQAAADVAAWGAQRQALRQLHAQVDGEALPPSLLQAAAQLQRRRGRLASAQRWGGMAAMLLLAFGIGWAGHAQWNARQDPGALGLARAFARQAEVAHAVYAPEVRHPVEVEAAQQEHLVQWLSKRLARPLTVPNLASHGYTLVGGRLLPGDQGARAQFMYQGRGGERITLYVGSLPSGESAFRFSDDGPAASFYWVDQGFGYALAGRLPRQQLLELAQAVHRQL